MSDGNGNSWDWPTEADKARIAEAHGIKPRWSLWATRYEQFRLVGPGRSVLAVYNQERDKAGKSGKQSAPGSWGKYSGDWLARAEKWDEAERKREAKEREAEEQRLREEARQQRRQLLRAMYGSLAFAIALAQETVYVATGEDGDGRPVMKKVTVVNAKGAAQFTAAMARYNQDSRAEFGDLPTQHTDLTSKGEKLESQPQVVIYLPDNGRDSSDQDDQATGRTTDSVPVESG